MIRAPRADAQFLTLALVSCASAANVVCAALRPSRKYALIASLPPCMIGMEAYSGAPNWARLFRAHGHTVRLMASKLVALCRMSG